jgi:hypothetical protein
MKKGVEALKEAAATIAARGETYGDPIENMNRTANLWGGVLTRPVSASQVALCMIQLKIARLMETPNHKDSVVDIMGYAAVLRECQEDE